MRRALTILAFVALTPSLAFGLEMPRHCDIDPGDAEGGITTVYFDTGKTEILGEGKHWLEVKSDQMIGNPNIWICIIGQADKQGSQDANAALALKRAEVVANYLESLGVARSQMKLGGRAEAWGNSSLGGLLGSAEEEGTADDRRVDVYIVRWSS